MHKLTFGKGVEHSLTRRSRSQSIECWWSRDPWRSFVSTRAGQNQPPQTDFIWFSLFKRGIHLLCAWKSKHTFPFFGSYSLSKITFKYVQGDSQGIQVRLLERCRWNWVRLYGEKYKYKCGWHIMTNMNEAETEYGWMVVVFHFACIDQQNFYNFW